MWSARARYEEALAVCQTIGDQSCMGTDLDSIGVLRRRQGDLRGALEMHRKALDVRRAVGDRAGVATSLYNMETCSKLSATFRGPGKVPPKSLDIRRQLGERRSAALTLSRLGNIRRREGEVGEALRMSEESLSALRASATAAVWRWPF